MAAISERPHPGDLLTLAFETINARGAEYDNGSGLEQHFREIAAITSIVTGKAFTPRDIAMMLVCVKLIRSKSAPDKLDNYVDGMNYMAFAACFSELSGVKPSTPQEAFRPAKAAE